jgi:hypothetical protein
MQAVVTCLGMFAGRHCWGLIRRRFYVVGGGNRAHPPWRFNGAEPGLRRQGILLSLAMNAVRFTQLKSMVLKYYLQ